MTRYIDVVDVQELASRLGVATMMTEMACFIREDFLRWEKFQKSPRTANHSEVGVIELMPTSDGQHYAFKVMSKTATLKHTWTFAPRFRAGAFGWR